MQPRTDFSSYSHGQLYQMLHAGDERTTRTVADSWDGVGARLHEQAGNLEARLARFRQHWRGGAAEQYQIMIDDLGAGLRRIGDAAFAMRNVAHDAGDALVTAKTRMPVPAGPPQISATTVALATTRLDLDPLATPAEVAQLRARQTEAATELARYQQAMRFSDAAHARAVAVMTELAAEYQAAGGRIPVPPEAGVQHGESEEDGAWAEQSGVDRPEGPDPERGSGPPVFGMMFTAGVAAAAAATAGRLGTRLLPAVPGWAKKGADRTKPLAGTGTPDLGKALGGIGGGGGASIGGGGAGGFGGGGTPAAPAAHAGLSGSGQAAAPGAALRAAAGAAGTGAAGMPFMPMMPFAPMGGEGASARRIPPWLTETEDVWGESAVITPAVLGEDPPEERHRPLDFPYQ